MSEEEIEKALKIIKEPITVNCINYKYFDEEDYNKLINAYENMQLKEDNMQLKEKNKSLKGNIKSIAKQSKCRYLDIVQKIKEIDKLKNKVEKLKKENIDLSSRITQLNRLVNSSQKMIGQQDDKIKKAIEYINTTEVIGEAGDFLLKELDYMDELLEILDESIGDNNV